MTPVNHVSDKDKLRRSVCHTSEHARKSERHQSSSHNLARLALAYILGDARGHYVKEGLCTWYALVILLPMDWV